MLTIARFQIQADIVKIEKNILESQRSKDLAREITWRSELRISSDDLLKQYALRDQTESREAAQRVQEETVRLEAKSKRKAAEQALIEAESKRKAEENKEKARIDTESKKLAEQAAEKADKQAVYSMAPCQFLICVGC